MGNRREIYAKKLKKYYDSPEEVENNESLTRETEKELWTKQLEVTQHFTRDFVAEVRTERGGIVGKLVTFIKRIFRKGTYYIFKQFSDRVYDFQSRSMELSGKIIQHLLDLQGQQCRLEEEQQGMREEHATLLSNLERQQRYLEEEQQRLREEHATLLSDIEEQRRHLEEEQRCLREEQAVLSSNIETQWRHLEEERQRLKEGQAVLILDVQQQLESRFRAQAQVTDLLCKRLDEYYDQIKMMQSAFLCSPASEMDNKQMAVLYAYRYMLGRDPENMQIVWNNEKSWEDLRAEVMKSAEFKMKMAEDCEVGHVKVEGITYFFPPNDTVISLGMAVDGINWAKYDIENFITLADRIFYKGEMPEEGIFLDIGGNIGTTSIYCKLKLKQRFQFIAFEPVPLCAKLLETNATFNGVSTDITVEQVALSDHTQDHAAMRINRENWGNCALVDDGADPTPEETEIVSTITLDEYIAKSGVNEDDIKYIWLDVEGHEYEVLKGASNFLARRKVPVCMEYNQEIYKAQGRYEAMLELLAQNFDSFMVVSQVKAGNKTLRPIAELPLVWEEEDPKNCDLLLF